MSRPPHGPAERRLVVVLVAAALCGAVATALLSVATATARSTLPLDRTVDDWLTVHLEDVRQLLGPFVELARPVAACAVAASLALSCVVARARTAAIVTLVGPAVAVLVTEMVIRPLVGGGRHGRFVFPSGHATAITSVALVLVLLVIPGGALATVLPRVLARLLLVAAAVLPLFAGVALVGLGYHAASDVLGGVAVACTVVAVTALVPALVARTGPHG